MLSKRGRYVLRKLLDSYGFGLERIDIESRNVVDMSFESDKRYRVFGRNESEDPLYF